MSKREISEKQALEAPVVAELLEDTFADEKKPTDEYDMEDLGEPGDLTDLSEIIKKIAPTTDDPSLPCLTFRFWFLGLGLSAFTASITQIYYFKPQTVSISVLFIQLISYMLGNLMAMILPSGILNPGPFNVKEHLMITTMANTANSAAYAIDILAVQNLFPFGSIPGPVASVALLLSSQLIGYGIAGLLRKWLVYPSQMIWPSVLPTVALLDTLHQDKQKSRDRIRFFLIVFAAVFVYEFIPQYMFPLLGGVSIFCIANPSSQFFTNLFGGVSLNEGVGILNVSFDWNYISTMGPLYSPFWAQMNFSFGFVLASWIILPILYYNNVWNAQNFPFLSNEIYIANGSSVYPQGQILNADNTVNETAFEQIGNPWFSTSFAFDYVVLNLGVTALISHVILFYGKGIYERWAASKEGSIDNDIHVQLMRKYPEVPQWWYVVLYVAAFGVSVAMLYVNDTALPWWGLIIALIISGLLTLPFGIIQAISGQSFGLNVVSELIAGLIFTGRPVANMYFKTYGYNTMAQALAMVSDLKTGHYMKVPPRGIFIAQMTGTIIGAIINYSLMITIIHSQREVLLDPVGSNVWSGAGPQTFNSAAITWGAIGPMRMFGPGTPYTIVLWSLLIGFFLPIPFYILHRLFPKVGFEYVNIPIITQSMATLPGLPSTFFTSGIVISFISQFYMLRYRPRWFGKYNYVLSAALDAATSIMAFILTFAVFGGSNGNPTPFPVWWGNPNPNGFADRCCLNC